MRPRQRSNRRNEKTQEMPGIFEKVKREILVTEYSKCAKQQWKVTRGKFREMKP